MTLTAPSEARKIALARAVESVGVTAVDNEGIIDRPDHKAVVNAARAYAHFLEPDADAMNLLSIGRDLFARVPLRPEAGETKVIVTIDNSWLIDLVEWLAHVEHLVAADPEPV